MGRRKQNRRGSESDDMGELLASGGPYMPCFHLPSFQAALSPGLHHIIVEQALVHSSAISM